MKFPNHDFYHYSICKTQMNGSSDINARQKRDGFLITDQLDVLVRFLCIFLYLVKGQGLVSSTPHGHVVDNLDKMSTRKLNNS